MNNRIKFNIKSFINRYTDFNYVLIILFFSGILDATFLFVPVTGILLFYLQKHPSKIFNLIFITTSGLLIGSIISFCIGNLTVANATSEKILSAFQHIMPGITEANVSKVQNLLRTNSIWVLFLATYSPLPYGLFGFVSGMLNIDPVVFTLIILTSNTIKLTLFSLIFSKPLKYLSFLIKPTAKSKAKITELG